MIQFFRPPLWAKIMNYKFDACGKNFSKKLKNFQFCSLNLAQFQSISPQNVKNFQFLRSYFCKKKNKTKTNKKQNKKTKTTTKKKNSYLDPHFGPTQTKVECPQFCFKFKRV